MTTVKPVDEWANPFPEGTPEHTLWTAVRAAADVWSVLPIAIGQDPETKALTKRPLCDRGHKDATRAPAALRQMFADALTRLRPGEVMGYGLVPGSGGMVVVDIDVKGETDGFATLASLPDLPDTFTIDTPSGGQHRYFRRTEVVPQRNGSDGIDLRDSDGWVVGPAVRTPWGSWSAHNGSPSIGKAGTYPASWLNGTGPTRRTDGPLWLAPTDDRLEALDAASLAVLPMLTAEGATLEAFHPETPTTPAYVTLTRPGKSVGVSATLGYIGPGGLKVFTSNWPGRPSGSYYADQLFGTHANTPDVSQWPWVAVDLTTIADKPPRVATMLRRLDGHGLIYPGLIHALIGETESGKSWVSMVLAVEQAEAGRGVIYLDYEDDATTFTNRLDVLGASLEARRRIAYFSVDANWGNAPDHLLDRYRNPAAVIIDGVSEAMGLMGLDPIGTADAVTWVHWVRRWATTGAAVVTIDHAVKDKTQQGRWALGSQHKTAGVHVTYTVRPIGLLRPGTQAQVELLVGKDRPGDVRRWGGNAVRATDRLQYAAVLEFGSDLTGGWSLGNPTRDDDATHVPPDPKFDAARRAVITYLSTHTGEATTGRQITAVLHADGHARDTIREALDLLIGDGTVGRSPGPRNSHLHHLTGSVR